ncbi:MAG: SH3 domain-containing protein [Clostridium sp.]|nr:SH3 domain-containing protein [Clostridium sp.]
MKRSLYVVLSSLITLTSIIAVPAFKSNAAVQAPITRNQVAERATKLMDLTWTYSSNSSKIDSKYASYVTLPKQFQGVTTANFTGIPYNWGGIDGIDTYSYNAPWINFLDAVKKGAFAGNINFSSGLGYIPGTAGMDCSGFVQTAFNISDYKQSTTSLLNSYFTKINLSDLKHMDVLDKPGSHIVIFDKWGTLNGINGAYTYESTPDQTYGGIQGTKRYFISMNTINSGYIPARYVNIVDDSMATTTSGSSSTSSSSPTTSATAKFTTPGYAMISNVTTYANLRQNAGTNYAILTTIPKGTILNLLNYSNGWYQVTYKGISGWISETVLGLVPAKQYVTVNGVYMLNIRASASSTAQIIGTISCGQYAQKIDQNSTGTWYKININGITGWASSTYLKYIN